MLPVILFICVLFYIQENTAILRDDESSAVWTALRESFELRSDVFRSNFSAITTHIIGTDVSEEIAVDDDFSFEVDDLLAEMATGANGGTVAVEHNYV